MVSGRKLPLVLWLGSHLFEHWSSAGLLALFSEAVGPGAGGRSGTGSNLLSVQLKYGQMPFKLLLPWTMLFFSDHALSAVVDSLLHCDQNNTPHHTQVVSVQCVKVISTQSVQETHTHLTH